MKQLFFKFCLLVSLMLSGQLLNAQEKNITGRVHDTSGSPLPGVNVLIKETSTGTQTDYDGNFNIKAKVGDILQFSFIGMRQHEITVGLKSNYEIELHDDLEELGEVVVVGYGTQKKIDVTGAVSRANLKAFEDAPNPNIVQSLQGAIPGLNIGQVNSAGSTPSISIRGQTSLGGNTSVLIVVDGVMYTGSLNSLNPDDIESVDVLKECKFYSNLWSSGC